MRQLICNLCASLIALHGACALDLTPRDGVIQHVEGGAIATLEFADGKMRYSYIPPAKWRPTGGGNALSFFTPDADAAVKFMVVDKTKLQVPVTDPAPSQDEMQAWGAKFVPGGATKVQFVKLVPGPFPMARRASNEYLFTYDFSGTPTSLSISVVDFNDKQLFLLLVSASKHFEQIHQQAISSMFSWAAVEQPH